MEFNIIRKDALMYGDTQDCLYILFYLNIQQNRISLPLQCYNYCKWDLAFWLVKDQEQNADRAL